MSFDYFFMAHADMTKSLIEHKATLMNGKTNKEEKTDQESTIEFRLLRNFPLLSLPEERDEICAVLCFVV